MSGGLSRRAALSGAVGLVPVALVTRCVVPAAAAPSPDAALLRLCAEYATAAADASAFYAANVRTFEDEERVEEEIDLRQKRADGLQEAIRDAPAVTLTGWQAKARVALKVLRDEGKSPDAVDLSARSLLTALAEDLLAADTKGVTA